MATMAMECEHDRGMARVVRVDGGKQTVFVQFVEETDTIAIATARWHPAEPVLSLESGDLFEVPKSGGYVDAMFTVDDVVWSTPTVLGDGRRSVDGGR